MIVAPARISPLKILLIASGRFGIPYKDFKALEGEYVPGVGYVVSMRLMDFLDFSEKYPLINTPRTQQGHFA